VGKDSIKFRNPRKEQKMSLIFFKPAFKRLMAPL